MFIKTLRNWFGIAQHYYASKNIKEQQIHDPTSKIFQNNNDTFKLCIVNYSCISGDWLALQIQSFSRNLILRVKLILFLYLTCKNAN